MIVFVMQRLVSSQFRKLADEFESITNEGAELWSLLGLQGRQISSCPGLSQLIETAHSAYATAAHFGSYDIGLTYWPKANDYAGLRISFRELKKMRKWRKSGALRTMLLKARAEVRNG